MADWDDTPDFQPDSGASGDNYGNDSFHGSMQFSNSTRGRGRGRGRGSFDRSGGSNWRSNGQNRSNDSFNRRNDNRSHDSFDRRNDNRSTDSFDRRDDRSNGFSRNRERNFDNGSEKNIYVPSRFVGRVIGRGGSTISELQQVSGANIKVTKEQNNDETLVILKGTDEQIQKAEELIKEKTTENSYSAPPQRQSQNFNFEDYGYLNQDIDADKLNKEWAEADKEYEAYQKEKWDKVGKIVKKFYVELPEVANMSPEEVAEYREKRNNIVVKRTFENEGNTHIPNPVKTFKQAFHNFPEILEEIIKAGFEEPSPIQCQSWPILLGGEDLIGIAQTGTGKTLAFLLPALIHIDGQTKPRSERNGPTVLIFAPTRELAQQIERECNKYFYRDIKAVCVYGGGSRKDQIAAIESGADIVIATPGRFNDLYMAGNLPLDSITYVVLDEADRMLDMGFEPQIRKVMYAIRPDRQTVMTSATWPNAVRDLAKSYMVNPIQVYVGSLDLAATHTVTQTILMLDDEEHKFKTFVDFAISLKPHEKVICFTGKKTKADYISGELMMHNIFGATLHGSMEQSDREQALIDIASGTVQILIATDLASRGIDIDDISHVVNYDFPRNIEEYVHRVGRTGRAGKQGDSISYFTRSDWGSAKELIPILEEANQFVPEELYKMAERFENRQKFERPRRGGFNRR